MRHALRNGRIEWQRHALECMAERAIRRSDALEVLLSGELVEDYPDDHPFPSGLFLDWIRSRPLHVLAAFDGEREQVFMITTYEPDRAHFEADFKTRRTT
jgi:hypothetical protein